MRLTRKRRRGSVILISLIAVLALTMTVGAVQVMLVERMRQSTIGTEASLARRQALYLAEMGLNHVMFQANLAPAQPFPVSAPMTLDFTETIAMTRGRAGAKATCVITPQPPYPWTPRPAFGVTAELRLPHGTFTRSVYFDVGRATHPAPGAAAPQWALTRYVLGEAP